MVASGRNDVVDLDRQASTKQADVRIELVCVEKESSAPRVVFFVQNYSAQDLRLSSYELRGALLGLLLEDASGQRWEFESKEEGGSPPPPAPDQWDIEVEAGRWTWVELRPLMDGQLVKVGGGPHDVDTENENAQTSLVHQVWSYIWTWQSKLHARNTETSRFVRIPELRDGGVYVVEQSARE